MNISEFIETGGKKVIPNPKYNPRSKKNKEPRTIVVDDLEPKEDRAIDMARADLYNQWSVPAEETEKYRNYGLNWNPREAADGSLDAQLANAQSNFSKTANALGQTIVNEVLLGIPLGISDTIDFIIGSAMKPITGEENDYSNPVSDLLREEQEKFKEVAPIYTDPNGSTLASQLDGNLNWGYWMKNLPNIATTISLMVPGMVAAKGAGLLSKALKIRKAVRGLSRAKQTLQAGNELNWLQKAMVSRSNANIVNTIGRNVTNAGVMRIAENYQEAVQTNQESYKYNIDFLNGLDDEEYAEWIRKNPHLKDLTDTEGNQIDVSDRDAVAKAVAKAAADKTFKWDLINMTFDVMQVYGLKNAGSLYKRTFKNSNAVLRANKNKIRNINKTAEEIAAEEAKRSWLSKTWDKTRTFTKGNVMLVGSELSEGAEEAVNYVAQEEGLNYGKVLLGTEAESRFDNRFRKYWNSPELWDSMFWGVIGGVGFHKVGSAFNAIARKIEHNKKRKGDDTTKENLAWYDFGLDNETKDRINELTKRDERTQLYADRVAKIKGEVDASTGEYSGGVNPYTGQAITKDEADILLAQEENEYLTDIYLSAARNGNLGLLREFLKSDEVARFFAANGLGGASKQDIDARIAKLDKIDKLYEDYLTKVDVAANSISGDYRNLFAYDVNDKESKSVIEEMFREDDVPVEYLMMIAEQNTRAKLKIDEYESLLANERGNAETLLKELKDLGKVDATTDYESIVRLGVLSHQLGLLQQQREDILSNPTKAQSLSGQISLDNIKHEEELIKNLIFNKDNVNDDNALANVLFALTRSKSFVKLNDGKLGVIQGNRKGVSKTFDDFLTDLGAVQTENGSYSDFTKLDDFIINYFPNGKPKTGRNSQAIAQRVNQLQQSHRNVFSDNIDSFSKKAPTVVDGFSNVSMLEYLIEQEKANINLTSDEVAKEVGEINNSMAEARTNAINTSIDTLQRLFDKYALENEDSVEELDNLLYSHNDAHITSRMDDADKVNWDDAMKVLNLTSRSNNALKRQLRDILSRRAMIRAMMEAGAANVNGNEETQKSSTSANSVSANNQKGSINQSPTVVTQTVEPKKGQNEQQSPEQRTRVALSIDNDGTIKEVENGTNTVNIRENEDGSYEAIIPNDGSHADLLTNDKLFEIKKSVIDGGQVVENPILDTDENGVVNVVKRGVITDPAAQQSPAPTQVEPEPLGMGFNPREEAAEVFSSTGELAEERPGSVEGTYNLTIPDATNKVRSTLFKEVATDSNLDDVANSLLQSLVNDGLTKEEANNIITGILPRVKNMREKLSGNKGKAVKAISNLEERNALFMDNPNDEEAISNFEEAFKNVIVQYASDMKLNKIRGRYYIVTQDLLRYCNDVCEDKTIAEILYEGILKFIEKESGISIDYVIIDRSEITSDGFLKKVANSIEDNLSVEAQLHDHRVDVMAVIRSLSKEDREDVYKELEKLNVGDSLYYTLEDGYVVIQAGRRKNNRRTIGRLPLPRREDGRFMWITRDWNVDVKLDGNNQPVSKLKDFFVNLFSPNAEDKDAQYFNNLLMEYTFGLPDDAKKREARRKEILSELSKIYATERFEPFIATKLDDKVVENLTNLLRNLYGPMTVATNASINSSARSRIVTKSLDNWFNKLYESYEFANSLALRKTGRIVVSQIHKGRPRFTKGNTKNIASKALTSENRKKAKIGVTTYDGTIKTSDGTDTGISGHYGTTYVILDNGTDKVTINAWPVSITRPTTSNKVNQIRQAVEKEIDAAIDAYAKDYNYDRLYKFIDNLFGIRVKGVKTDSNGLFISAKDDAGRKKVMATSLQNNVGMKIYYGDKSLTIYRNYSGTTRSSNKVYFSGDQRANQASGEKTNVKLKKFFRELLNDLNYNINFNHIGNTEITSGFFTKNKKGNISIKIGDSPAIKFSSYEDMLIGNDLLELSIETNEDGTSNFYRLGEEIEESVKHNKAGQFLRVRLDSKKVTQPTPKEQTKVGEVTYGEHKAAVDNILSSEKTDVSEDGVDIISEVAPELVERLSNIEYNGGIISLLPNRLVLDTDMKEVAAFNKRTGVTRISKRVYDRLNSPNKANVYTGVKSLIHEKIHDILHRDGNEKYIGQIIDVYDEAKDAIAKMLKDNNRPNPFTTDDKGNITDDSLEEFITYSLTDSKFAKLLNSIDAEGNVVDKSNMSILQRIMNILAELFGWGIRDNSLYAKEFNALRDIMDITDDTNADITDDTTADIVTNNNDNQNENVKSDENKENLTDEDYWDEESFSMFEDELDTIAQRNNKEYTEEMQLIKDKAIADGTFMKAPNGNNSNLNERQWLQVRTKNFINWFGDWINDPANASKVVDENGEPLVVYHGTSRKLNNNSFKSEFIFASDNDIIGAGYGFQRKGFSIGIDYALSNFAGEDIESFGRHIDYLIKELENEIELGEDMPFYQEGDLDAKKNLVKELKKAKQEIKSRDIFKEFEFNVFNIFQNVKNPLIVDAKGKYWHSIEFEETTKNTDEIAKIAKDRGYDGLIITNVIDKGAEVSKNGEYAEVANDYIAFESNQIKSATDNIGTFSTENDDIRYSLFEDDTDASITISAVNLDNAVKQIPLSERNKFIDNVKSGLINQICN